MMISTFYCHLVGSAAEIRTTWPSLEAAKAHAEAFHAEPVEDDLPVGEPVWDEYTGNSGQVECWGWGIDGDLLAIIWPSTFPNAPEEQMGFPMEYLDPTNT